MERAAGSVGGVLTGSGAILDGRGALMVGTDGAQALRNEPPVR
jgi:hypothetical protein